VKRSLRARWAGFGLAVVTVAGVLGTTVPGAVANVRDAREQATPGGVLRLAAEEELYCADWIASCAALSWGNWSLGIHTLPQAFRVSPDGQYVPGPVLAGEPTVSAGPPITITYRIKPEAVWNDGTPITSKDFKYLWEQITTGKDIWDTTGYDQITAVDSTDPKTAVVTFSEPYAGWKDLFGGFYFLLPSHLLDGKNRHQELKDGYAFSGGPWMLDGGTRGWDQGKSLTLVPNPKYWGTKPKIGKVVFQFIPESAAETKALTTGQVLAAYPTPQTGMLDEFDKAHLDYEVGFGNQYEGLWLNADQWPMNSKAVRQSLLYATDRQAIVDQIVKPSVREGRVLQSFIVPSFPQYYSPAFSQYTKNQSMVEHLMTGDGWSKGPDGMWTKNGQKATLQVATTSGNEARELTQQLWQSQLRQAGFDLQIKNASADLLFGKMIPRGRFGVGLYAQVGTPDPGLCVVFCSKNIPSKANGYSGQNYTRLASNAIDAPWAAADRELDTSRRVSSVKQGQAALADEAVSIPLYQLPTVFVYNPDRLGGPMQDNTVEGPFFNLEEWYFK
jgi:peptide/nickel transport system substrate-binding protein